MIFNFPLCHFDSISDYVFVAFRVDLTNGIQWVQGSGPNKSRLRCHMLCMLMVMDLRLFY